LAHYGGMPGKDPKAQRGINGGGTLKKSRIPQSSEQGKEKGEKLPIAQVDVKSEKYFCPGRHKILSEMRRLKEA